MKEILKLIETVDPSDTAKLDAIDLRSYCYLNFLEYPTRYITKPVYFYTRSRDQLKAIRPEGWYITIDEYEQTSATLTEFAGGFRQVTTPWLPTEELAELHAILQAIEHERSLENPERT